MPTILERTRTNGAIQPAQPPPSLPPQRPDDNSGYWAAFSLLLGLLVVVLGAVGVWLGFSAHEARDDARKAARAAAVGAVTPGMDMSGGSDLQSFAGQAPANADALAKAHRPMDATLPPAPSGPVARVHLVLVDKTIEIAPGVKYDAWAFSGGAPAPFIHVRQGQKVEVTLTNRGAIPHSVDFHAARIAPNVAFKDVAPGASIRYSFVARDPGAFMFHCGTKPVLAHIANGMYGAIIVDPPTPLPNADKNFVLVASEWYLDSPGLTKPAHLDMSKAQRQ
jgi:nitrite reductase (NO-forming)